MSTLRDSPFREPLKAGYLQTTERHGAVSMNEPRGSIYTTIMELGPKNHNGDGLLGPNSIMVVYMDPLGKFDRASVRNAVAPLPLRVDSKRFPESSAVLLQAADLCDLSIPYVSEVLDTHRCL